jgi:hypothetical protein
MSITATGCISRAEEALRVLVADAAAFRTLVGAADRASALIRVYRDALPPPAAGREYTLAEMQAYRPFAIVFTAPENGYTANWVSGGTGNGYGDSGELGLFICRDTPLAYVDDFGEAMRGWKNILGDLIDDMKDLAGTSDYLLVRQFRLAFGPQFNPEDEHKTIGDIQYAQLSMQWGLE